MKIRQVLVVVKRTSLSRLKGSKNPGDIRLRKLVESGHPSTLVMRLAHEERAEQICWKMVDLRMISLDGRQAAP